MKFSQIKIGQKFKFIDGYGGPNRPRHLKEVIYEKTEPTPPREQTYYDFQSKNAIWTNGDYKGMRVFFCDEEKSFDCFEVVE